MCISDGHVQQWLQNESQCGVILDPSVNRIGVGATSKQTSTNDYYWAVDVSRATGGPMTASPIYEGAHHIYFASPSEFYI